MYICIYVYTYMNAYIYICIYIDTYIHILSKLLRTSNPHCDNICVKMCTHTFNIFVSVRTTRNFKFESKEDLEILRLCW